MLSGFREKVFAIIGVKIYAAGFYISQSISSSLDAWRSLSADNLKQDSALFDTILKGNIVQLDFLLDPRRFAGA